MFEAEKRVADAAEGIGRGDPGAIAVLMEALLLSGISMKMAGSSAPASGAEHLISHYWDMTASSEGRVEGWHGAQVGVATIVSAGLYGYLRNLDPAGIDPDALCSSRPDLVDDGQLQALHGSWWKLARRELDKKTLSDKDYVEELAKVLEGWERMWSHLDPVLRPADRVRRILEKAGAPTRVGQLGLTGEQLERAFVAARQIRARLTVLDLCAELGLLENAKKQVCGFVK
ncbi:MAG: iron-containing alcohol dehydrogenase [Deltaproteobacteria bacterium]|nr:MAG: iron-containing alcohol dehydrogenase [Deltaproteobacteria bacterium]